MNTSNLSKAIKNQYQRSLPEFLTVVESIRNVETFDDITTVRKDCYDNHNFPLSDTTMLQGMLLAKMVTVSVPYGIEESQKLYKSIKESLYIELTS